MLEARDLVKSYRGRRVVSRVSLDVESGEIVGLLGKNGAGKTTTFRMVMGLVKPDGGSVRFDGEDVARWPMHRRARAGMGYLCQETSVFRGLTTEHNLDAILEREPIGRAERRRRREELLSEFGLEKVRGSLASSLSGGEKRRLEIARALVTRPRLILLDEPFAGVDPIAVAEIQRIVQELRARGIAVLLTDHNVRETLSTTDRAYIIEEGRVLMGGTPAEIIADPLARRVYLGEGFRMELAPADGHAGPAAGSEERSDEEPTGEQ